MAESQDLRIANESSSILYSSGIPTRRALAPKDGLGNVARVEGETDVGSCASYPLRTAKRNETNGLLVCD